MSPQGRETGFSLIETMIALLLAIFGLLTAGQLLGVSINCMSLARLKDSSILVARNKLEDLRDLYRFDPSHADLAAGDHGPEEITVRDPLSDDTLNRFRIKWSTSGVSEEWLTSYPAALSASVTVTPVSGSGSSFHKPPYNRKIRLTTILSPRIR